MKFKQYEKKMDFKKWDGNTDGFVDGRTKLNYKVYIKGTKNDLVSGKKIFR